MNASVSKPQKRVQAVLEHASGDKRFKILEVHMKKHQFRQDALIEVLHKAQELFGYLEDDLLLFVSYNKLSLLTARCIGACGIAPAVVYDGTVTPRATPESALEKINQWVQK